MIIKVTRASTLIEFLTEHYPDSPATRIKKILKSGKIRINDRQVTLHSYKLKPGDVVEITRTSVNAAKAGLPFAVLYDDNDVIVIEKPPGRPTSSEDGSLSIKDMLSGYLQEKTRGRHRAWVVHRLDKEVSGVLLFAKTRENMEILKERWKETEKHYYALVEGVPVKAEGTIKSWLTEDKGQKVYSGPEREGAKFAVTHYRTVKVFRDYALLDVSTETGRKNQIRVHLSGTGHPIVGDRRYGASAEYKRRIRLHAWSLSFPHPGTGKIVTVKSNMPEGFLSLRHEDEKYK